jgi:geranylgeranyl diphosphate synthase, type III
MQTKSFCEDLTEGKFSFPIIHSVINFPEDTRLLNILRQKTEDVDVKKHAVKWMEHTGSMTYTRDTLKVLHSEVLSAINDLGGHVRLTALVNKLDAELDDMNHPENPDSGSKNNVKLDESFLQSAK